jgi:hypothetical protein
MIALNPGNLCTHHVYTVDGKPDRFFIYPIDYEKSDDLHYNWDNNQYYILAEEIFMILASPTCVGTASGINILTSAGIIGTIMVHPMYDDRFVLVNGGE